MIEEKYSYKDRISIVRMCLKDGQNEKAGPLDNPIEYGYKLACQNALRLIDKYLADFPADDGNYPLGRNDWQE